jgi:hypothetical protein
VRLDGGTVDQHLRGWTARRGERMKHVDPNAFRRPADEAVVERLARSINGGRVDPSAAGFEHVNDAADHPSIIDARLAARVGRKKRLEPRELFIRQPKEIAKSNLLEQTSFVL